MKNIELSIVVPVYKCESSLREMHRRLTASLSGICDEYEIIFIDDGSIDNAWNIIRELANSDKHVLGISLSRNFGQHYAILAGLENSRGKWVVVMDCDLQDVPEEIPRLYKTACEGYDIVFAKRAQRKDGFLKRMSSILFYRLLGYLTDTFQDPAVANFGIYNRKAINAVISMRDAIKYFPVMIRWVGFNSTSIEVKHSERMYDSSSYSFARLLNLAISIILSFSDKPLRIVVKLGFFISAASFLFSLYIFIRAILNDIQIPGWASTIMSVWFLSGLVIMVLGIVGIYIGKIFDQVKGRPLYIVKDKT